MRAYAAALSKTSRGLMVRVAAVLVANASAVGCARGGRPANAPLSFAECAGSVPAPVTTDAGGGATPMVMRVDADLTDDFALSAVCLRIDGQRVYVRRLETPSAIRARVDLPVRLRSATSHAIELVAEYAGRRDYTGYKFSLHSVHSVTPENVPDGVVGVHILDLGGGRQFEQRPTVEWTVPSDPPPTAAPTAPNSR